MMGCIKYFTITQNTMLLINRVYTSRLDNVEHDRVVEDMT